MIFSCVWSNIIHMFCNNYTLFIPQIFDLVLWYVMYTTLGKFEESLMNVKDLTDLSSSIAIIKCEALFLRGNIFSCLYAVSEKGLLIWGTDIVIVLLSVVFVDTLAPKMLRFISMLLNGCQWETLIPSPDAASPIHDPANIIESLFFTFCRVQ